MNIDINSSSSDEEEDIKLGNQLSDITIEHIHRYMFRLNLNNGYATADEVFYATQQFLKSTSTYECLEVSVENVELSHDGLESNNADALKNLIKSQIETNFHNFKDIEQNLKQLHGVESNGIFDRFMENIAGKDDQDDQYEEDPLGLLVNHEILAYEIDRFWATLMETENTKSCDNRRQAYNKYKVIIEGYDYKNFERFKTDIIPLSDNRSLSFIPLDNNNVAVYNKEIDDSIPDLRKNDKKNKKKAILQAESIQIGVYSQGEDEQEQEEEDQNEFDVNSQDKQLKKLKKSQSQPLLFFEELFCLKKESLWSLEMFKNSQQDPKQIELIATVKAVGKIKIVAPFSNLHMQKKQLADFFWLVPSQNLEFYLSTEIRRVCNGSNYHAKWIRIPNFILSLSHSTTLAKILATQSLAFKLNQTKPYATSSQSQLRYNNSIDPLSYKYQFMDEQFTEQVAQALNSINYFKVSYAILLLFARNQIKFIEIGSLCDYLTSQVYLQEEQMIAALDSVYLMKKDTNVVSHIQKFLSSTTNHKKSSKSKESSSHDSKKINNQGLCEVIRLTISSSSLIFEPIALEPLSSFQKEILIQPLLRVQINEDSAFNTQQSQRTLALFYRTLLSFFKVQQLNYHYFGHSQNLSSALLLPTPQPQTPRGLQDAVEKVAQFSSIQGGATEQAFTISRVLEKSVLLKTTKLITQEDPQAISGTISDKEFSKIQKQIPALEDSSIVLLQIKGYTCTFFPSNKLTTAYSLPKKLYTHQSKSPGVYLLDYSTCQVGSLPREIAMKIYSENQLQQIMNKTDDFSDEYLKFENNLIKFHLQIHFKKTITALKYMDYPFNADPFFTSILASLREKELKSSRVFPDNCYQLFAMVDREDILAEGEVFILLKKGKQNIQAVTGDVVLVNEGKNEISAQPFKAIPVGVLADRFLQVDKYSSMKNIVVISKASSNFVKADGRVTLLVNQNLDNPIVISVKNPRNILADEETGQEELGLRKSLSIFSANLAQIKSTQKLQSNEQLQPASDNNDFNVNKGKSQEQQQSKLCYVQNQLMETHPIVGKLIQRVDELLEFIESDDDFSELILQRAKDSFQLIETLETRIKALSEKRQITDIFECMFPEKELLDWNAMEEISNLALLLCSQLLDEVFSGFSKSEKNAIYQPYNNKNSLPNKAIDEGVLMLVQLRFSLFYLMLSFDLSSENEFLKYSDKKNNDNNSTLRKLLKTIRENEEVKQLILKNKSRYCRSKENQNILLQIQGIFWIAASHFMLHTYQQKE